MAGSWLSDDDLNPEPYRSRFSLSNEHAPDRPAENVAVTRHRGDAHHSDSDAGKTDSTKGSTRKGSFGTRSKTKHPPTGAPRWAGALSAAGVIAAIAVVVFGVIGGNGETATAGGVMLLLGAFTVIALRRVAADTSNGEYQILVAGLAMKLLATLLRYGAAFSGALYSRSDAATYDTDGRKIAADFLRHGNMPGFKSYTGSNFLRLITGLLYTVMPPSTLAAFFVFGWFSFCGYVMFWRALRRTVGPGQDRRYLCMLLFMPSVAYWPASLGKESVVILGLGLASLGVARTMTRAGLSGAAMTAAGIVLVTYVRPHVAIVVVIGLTIALIFQKRGSGQFVSTIAVVAMLIPIGGFAVSQASAYFKGDITQQANIDSTLSKAQSRTAQGNSQFDAQPVTITNPIKFPYAALTVIVRPFPWESPSIQEFATSIESAIIGWMLLVGFRRAIGHVRRDNPYAIYALVNIIVFIILFSNFNNFGILARQRTQVAPFLFLLLALPERTKSKKKKSRRDVSNWEYPPTPARAS